MRFQDCPNKSTWVTPASWNETQCKTCGVWPALDDACLAPDADGLRGEAAPLGGSGIGPPSGAHRGREGCVPTSRSPKRRQRGRDDTVNSDRFSVSRSRHSTAPEDAPADLIDFTIRGPRGAVKGRSTVDARLAERYWRQLGELLGKPEVAALPPTPPSEQHEEGAQR